MFEIFPIKNGLENVEGFYFGSVNSDFKKDEDNIGFIRSDEPFLINAIFTSNNSKSAPIRHFLRYEKDFKSNFLLINSKNSNAMTGENGINDIDEIFKNLSKKLELVNPVMSSTGVISCRLKKDKIIQSFDKFNFYDRNSNAIATAIMTTNVKKELACEICLENGEKFHIAAICSNGSGAINSSLPAMLCFILTDAKIPQIDMQNLLEISVKQSFDCIDINLDVSMNDSIMLLSSQKNSYDKTAFQTALNLITKELSLMILKDNEGVNKLVKFEILGAKNDFEAQKVAKNLANSIFIKTVIFDEDPNYGQIASIIGASGVCCDDKKLIIKYDDLLIYDEFNTELNEEKEKLAKEIIKKDNFTISCNLNIANGQFCAFVTI